MHPGYRGLVTLAERELELVRDGEIDELGALWEERRRLVGDLPAIPPPSALGWLEQAAALQGRTTALLEERLEATGAEMRRIVNGRSAMRSYAHETPRTKLVDRAG